MKFLVKHVLQDAKWKGPLQRLGQKQAIGSGAEEYRHPPRHNQIQHIFIDEADQVVFLAHDTKDDVMCIESVLRVYSIHAALVKQLQALNDFVPLKILNIMLLNSLKSTGSLRL